MNRSDLQALAKVRLSEARHLFSGGFHSGAFYLAGYSVECALKACIAKRTQLFDFPDKTLADKVWIHDLLKLRTAADLDKAFEAADKVDPSLSSAWNVVKAWRESSRYTEHGEQQARELLEAVDDGSKGVLPWLTQHW